MHTVYKTPVAVIMLMLGACTSVPTGPSAMALPGTGKNFDQFRSDDRDCRQYALEQSGATPAQSAENSGVKSAAIGAAIGAVAGAAMDGSSGAATGAGVGLLMGGIAGAGAANQSAYMTQRRYDHGYIQCMYAKGHRVPVSGQYTAPRRGTVTSPPPPAAQAPAAPLAAGIPPPPPPGSPPPPPSAIVP